MASYLPAVGWGQRSTSSLQSAGGERPTAEPPGVVLLCSSSWALSRRASNRAAHSTHGNSAPKGRKAPGAPTAPVPFSLRPADWPVPVRDPTWAGGADGVVFLGDLQPTLPLIEALSRPADRILLVTLRRPPATPLPNTAPLTPEQVPLPLLRGDRLLVRTSFVFRSPAAASLPLPGCPPPSDSSSPSTSQARTLTAPPDTLLVSLELAERWAPNWSTVAQGGARALRQLLSPLLPSPHRLLDLFSLATRGELLGQRVLRATARIPAAALSPVLRLSGTGASSCAPSAWRAPPPTL